MVEVDAGRTEERFDRRNCELCGSKSSTVAYAQRFASFDDFSGLAGYDVVICDDCSFAYADYLPEQAALDRYYRDLSKYEQHETSGAVPAWAAVRNRAIVEEISSRLPDRNARILDVGCATGHLLAAFRDAGFANITGLDPSKRCVELAQELYGIRVINIPISGMRFDTEKFDLILVSAVLEHLRDLPANIKMLTSMLSDGGAIWFEVPDAGRFSEYAYSPFQQFSLEHINFFTARSLTRLMSNCGFEPLAIWEPVRTVRSYDEPGLDGLFTRAGRGGASSNRGGDADIVRYIAASKALESRLLENIRPMVAERTPVILWGTGSLTLHLLTQPTFSELNIKAFVDSNPNYQGKTIRGIPVIAPEDIRNTTEPLMVVSHASALEIRKDIRERYKLSNRIVEPLPVH